MKKLISLLFMLAILVGYVSAQSGSTVAKAYKVTSDIVFTAKGAASDTIIKNGVDRYYIYANPFADYIRVNAKVTRTKGTYSKFRTVVKTSYDGVNWVRSDSVSIANATAAQNLRTTIFNAKAPYLCIETYAYDSTQTQKIQYFILIDNSK